MNRSTRLAARSMVPVLGLVALVWPSREPAPKAASALEAPISAGYEEALGAGKAKPIFRPAGTAPAVYGPGDVYNMLVRGEESEGRLFQFEAIVPDGGGPPPHVHSREDETFYVVSGKLDILMGDRNYSAKAGDFVYIPRGTPHRFKNVGGGQAVQLVTFVGAGMEKYFEEVFPKVTDRSAPPPPITQEFLRKMSEAAPKYGMEMPVPPEARTK
jgi:mannose-6-phosphate isomerase-like protein (cupin superfamily)